MANKFQFKRTTVSGRTPNTTNSSNTTFIDKGELAFNLADRKLYSSDSANGLFEIGSNVSTLSVQTISANGTVGTSGQVLASNGTSVYWTTSTGYTGSAGVTGFTGSKGDTGTTGFTGSKGDTGTTGFTGSKGDQGNIGYTGSQGVGYTGSQGSTGYTGSAALGALNWVQNVVSTSQYANTTDSFPKQLASVTITTSGNPVQIGAFGDANPLSSASWGRIQIYRGATAISSNVQFESSNANENNPYAFTYIDNPAAGTYTYYLYCTQVAGGNVQFGEDGGPTLNAVELQNVLGYTGSHGFTGSQGNIGYTGSQGTTGFTGSQGSLGYTGSKGDQGVIGYTGSQGIQGIQGFTGSEGSLGYTGSKGDQGTTGFTGSKGDQGIQGFTGSKGDTGSTGFTGSKGDQGIQGFTGSQGDQGTTGFTGSKGDQGIIGFTGSKGDQGNIGYTGSKGDQGVIGYTGSKGDQGNLGYTGSQGDIGYTGSKGDQGVIGYTGSQGSLGYTGSKGDPGTFGGAAFDYTFDTATTLVDPGDGFLKFNNTTFSSANTLIIHDNDDNSVSVYNYLQTIDDSTSAIKGHFTVTEKSNTANFTQFSIVGLHSHSGNSFQVPVTYLAGVTSFTNNLDIIITFARTGDRGDTGFTGSQGTTGFTGSKGDQGNIGYTGSKGDTGTTGFTGSKGDQGVIGFTGSKGDTGSTGFTGSQGDQGIIGFTGSKGDTGSTGFTGSKGDQGVIGYTGSQGDQGVTGYTGSKGDQGVIGYTGSQGDQGVTGYTGSKGDQGVIGYTGSQGSIGYTGSSIGASSNTQIIFNDSGFANGASTLTYNKSTGLVSLGTSVTDGKLYVYDGTNDKYGFGIRSSQFMIYSGAGGAANGGITLGEFDGTTFTENVRFQNDGNIGIGVNPAQSGYTGGSGYSINMKNTSSVLWANSAGGWNTTTAGGAITYWSDNNMYVDAKDSTSSIIFRAGNDTERMRISSTSITYAANIAMANNNITRPILTGYTEHEVSNTAATGTWTMDCGAANFFDLTLTGNITISPTNVPPSTRVWAGTIAAKQDATGGRTITWPTGIKWPGGSAPPATTTANAIDIWSLMTYDGGTTWVGSLSVKNVA